ncbi:MAG TPA: hypothetical protein ENI23_00695 [bacterium]|nr:hypothetical protein [bacterium]
MPTTTTIVKTLFGDELIACLVSEMDTKYRLICIETVLDRPPDEDEKSAALFDALQDINSAPPQTFFSMENIAGSVESNVWSIPSDTRWLRLLLLGAARSMAQTLIWDWTANGFIANIDDFEIESKLSDFQALESQLSERFNEILEKLKETSQKFVKGVPDSGHQNFNPNSRFRTRTTLRFT